MSELISTIFFAVLRFPVSHFISGWMQIKESWHLITLVRTESSLLGVGEGTPYGTNVIVDYSVAVKLASMIRGMDIEEATRILKEIEYKALSCDRRVAYGAFLSVESALLDALSKCKRTSIARLLDDEHRDNIPVAGTIFLKHPRRMAREANTWISRGVKHLKLKIPCNLEDLEKTLNTIIRDFSLDNAITLRVDANQCFKQYDKAIKALRIMEKYGVNIVEQPLPRNSLRDTARLRKLFHPTIKIMLDESLIRPHDIKTFAELEVADIVNFHPSKLGCLSITRETALHAKRLGMEVQIGSALMTEIGLTHYLNLAASIPALDYPLEEVGLSNTSYGYSITCDPSVFDIERGHIRLATNIEIKNLCYDYVKPFSMNRFLFLERLVSEQVMRLTRSSDLPKKLLRVLV